MAYFFPESQFLLFLALCSFVLGELLARDFALVEAGEVFFAGAEVEFDFLGDGDGDFALLGGRAHDCRLVRVVQLVLLVRVLLLRRNSRLRFGTGKLLQGSGAQADLRPWKV